MHNYNNTNAIIQIGKWQNNTRFNKAKCATSLRMYLIDTLTDTLVELQVSFVHLKSTTLTSTLKPCAQQPQPGWFNHCRTNTWRHHEVPNTTRTGRVERVCDSMCIRACVCVCVSVSVIVCACMCEVTGVWSSQTTCETICLEGVKVEASGWAVIGGDVLIKVFWEASKMGVTPRRAYCQTKRLTRVWLCVCVYVCVWACLRLRACVWVCVCVCVCMCVVDCFVLAFAPRTHF